MEKVNRRCLSSGNPRLSRPAVGRGVAFGRFLIPILAFFVLSSNPAAADRSVRIIGGEPAAPDAWPWMVAIVRAGGSDNRLAHFCGGALLHPRWVVTAAHCADGKRPETIEVLSGSVDLDSPEMASHPVRRIVVHPDYRAWSGDDHDIALLELETPRFAERILPVPPSGKIEGEEGVVPGWGVTAESSRTTPAELREVALPVVSNETCNAAFNAYDSRFYDDPVTENMVCAGPAEGGRDACYGDSGGPLMVFLEGRWRLAGIVSWGEGCAEPDLYGVYTRVSRYLDFLRIWVPVPGDATGDGRLGPADAIGILQMVAGIRSEGTESPSSGDWDLDGSVTVGDAAGVLRTLVE
jgi:secreted trypsin-like serine protease